MVSETLPVVTEVPSVDESLAWRVGTQVGPYAGVFDDLDMPADLQWPKRISTYQRMARDPDVGVVLQMLSTFIASAAWTLDGDSPAPVVEHVRNCLGLLDEEALDDRPAAFGVHWPTLVEEMLVSLEQGFAAHTPRFKVDETSGRLVLSAMLMIPHETIDQLYVGPTGELLGITQRVTLPPEPPKELWPGAWPTALTGGLTVSPGLWHIPARFMTWNVHRKRAANWFGQPMLRDMYAPWKVKDGVLRIAAVQMERNGLGIPKATVPPGADKGEVLEELAKLRAGMNAAIVVPEGSTLELMGVTGTLIDPIPLMRYLGEQIVQSHLAMVLKLGHDSGARSLGETFVDIFAAAMLRPMDGIRVVAQRLIRWIVDVAFGKDVKAPILKFHPVDLSQVSALDLLTKMTAGMTPIIRPDDKLETFARRALRLPVADTSTVREPATPVASGSKPVQGSLPGMGGAA